MATTLPPAEKLFPIRAVCSLTGINPVTLRAWERRYGLIRPIRTPGGHRLYTHEHINQIKRAMAMLERGLTIGAAARTLRRNPAAQRSEDPWGALRAELVAAISRFDEAALDAAYEWALGSQPVDAVARKLMLPLLAELGRRWQSQEGSVAEEHFFTTYTRNILGARLHQRPRSSMDYKLLCACAPGERHEIGLLLFALAAHERRMGCVLLGADTPLNELPTACARSACDGLVISTSMAHQHGWMEGLCKLVESAGRPVFVGGRSSIEHKDELTKAGVIVIGTDIARGLRQIRSILETYRA